MVELTPYIITNDVCQQINTYYWGVYVCYVIDWIVYSIIINGTTDIDNIKELVLSEADLIQNCSLMAYIVQNNVMVMLLMIYYHQ